MGRLSLHPTADALKTTRSAPPWWRLDRCDTFLVLAKFELTALRRDGRGLRLGFEKKRWFA